MTANNQESVAHSIKELSARIARLALALGISLESDAEVTHALNHREFVTMHDFSVSSTDNKMPFQVNTAPGRRQCHLHEELRALLTMRYNIEALNADEVGVIATRKILIVAETQLEREGFQQGSTGIDLKVLL